MLFFRVTLAASLLLFSVSAIPAPPREYYDPVKSAPGQYYDAVRDAPSSNIDSRPPAYGAYAPSVPPLAPQLQPSTPKSPARASGSSSTRSKLPDSKRQRSPNDGGSPSSQSPAKAIKGSDKPFNSNAPTRVAKRLHSEENATWRATCAATTPVQKNVTHASIAIPHSPGKTI
ncbi:hypothetical protein C8J56DRAFT_1065690 [Mycena floridula]|nr:hypothetical protein C8J56DRAFT_1065690 [Mycena floridula]